MNPMLTGAVLPQSAFRVSQSRFALTEDDIFSLLDGTIAAVHVTDAIDDITCGQMCKRFWHSSGRRPRSDGVEGHYLGAYHYGKTFKEYMAEVDYAAPHWEDLFEGLLDPVHKVIDNITQVVGRRGITVRPATWRGQSAALARMLAWSMDGDFLLEPHDDIGQLQDPRQAGFEIQEVAENPVLAVNIYPRISDSGGLLRIWNIWPDVACRQRFGLQSTGFPYPLSALEGVSFMDVPVMTGSMAVANGGLIHAVTAAPGGSHQQQRITINFFLGRLDDHTIIHWV